MTIQNIQMKMKCPKMKYLIVISFLLYLRITLVLCEREDEGVKIDPLGSLDYFDVMQKYVVKLRQADAPVNVSEFKQIKEFEKVEDSKPPADPTPRNVLICHKPAFFESNNCGVSKEASSSKRKGPVQDYIALDVSKMPFNLDQWLHVDVIPSPMAQASKDFLMMKSAYIQISDTKNQVLGRVAERIPCVSTGHPMFPGEDGKQELKELYQNPGVKNIDIFECKGTPKLNVDFKPTVACMNFDPPVMGFYVNFKFTREEFQYLQRQDTSQRIQITLILVDTEGACYLFRVEQLDGLPSKPMDNVPVEVPIKCHDGGPAFIDPDKKLMPFLMSLNSSARMDKIKFGGSVGPRAKSDMVFISKHDWRTKVDSYNMKTHNLDPFGYLPGERQAENEEKEKKNTAVRRPGVPLIIPIPDEPLPMPEFASEDTPCQDKAREKLAEGIRDKVARLYFDCGHNAQCMGEPWGCQQEKNCEYLVSWTKSGDFVAFSIIAYAVRFASVALSEDYLLGNDSVTECVREENNVVGYSSWNVAIDEYGAVETKRMRTCDTMMDYEGGMVDQQYTLFCSWKRPIKTNVKGREFDLDKPYYVILTAGFESTLGVLGSIGTNEFVKTAISTEILNRYIGKTPFQKWVTRLHGLLMVIAWLFTLPVATFVARYMQRTFTKCSLGKNCSFWFTIHFTCTITVSGLTFFSVIFLLVTNKHEWDKFVTWHSMSGLVVCFLIFCQIGLAYMMLRYKGKLKDKVNFSMWHGFVGALTAFTGYFCIFMSRHVREGLHCDSKQLLIWLLMIYICFHASMSYIICYTDFVEGREPSRIYKIFLVTDRRHKEEDLELNDGEPEAPPPPPVEVVVQDEDESDPDDKDENFKEDSEEEVIEIQDEVNENQVEVNKEMEIKVVRDYQGEEPGAPCIKVSFLIFIAIFGAFNLYFVWLVLHPDSQDCVTVEGLTSIGRKYTPGVFYERK